MEQSTNVLPQIHKVSQGTEEFCEIASIGTDSYVWRVNVPDEVIVNAEVWVAVVAAVAVVFSIVIIVAKITNHRSKSRKFSKYLIHLERIPTDHTKRNCSLKNRLRSMLLFFVRVKYEKKFCKTNIFQMV